MAHNQLLPRPPHYRTSRAVRSAISLAYSTHFNRRSLESLWYGPYTHTFTEMVASYHGDILVHPQYTLYIPSLVAREVKLRQQYADAGLDWDAMNANHNGGARVAENVPGGGKLNADLRKSNRVALARQRAAEAAEKQAKGLRTHLARLKAELDDDLLDSYESKSAFKVNKQLEISANELYDPDNSITSIDTSPDGEVLKEEPDFVLSHVATIELPEPQSETAWLHYRHRAGVKVFHLCSVLLAEIKQPPSRGPTAAVVSREVGVSITAQLEEAQDDLLEYCAAHFLREPDARSVYAFAAAGPFWRWAVILRDDVPQVNWLLKTVLRGENAKVAAFHRKFGDDFFSLGQPASDTELTNINQTYIYPIVNDVNHTGQVPQLDDDDETEEA